MRYSLIEPVKDNGNLTINEIMPALWEANKAYENRRFLRNGEDLSEKIHIDF